jgi:hypothetical protein
MLHGMDYMELFANATKVMMTEALKYEVAPRLFLHAVRFGPLGPIAGKYLLSLNTSSKVRVHHKRSY